MSTVESNQLILTKTNKYSKQSNIVTFMSTDYKLLQLKVVSALMEKLQNAIEDSVRINNKGEKFEQLQIFSEFENSNELEIKIEYSSLGIKANQYPELRNVVKQLAVTPVEFDIVNPKDNKEYTVVSGLLKAIFPKDIYGRYFIVQISRDVTQILLNMNKGFTRYLQDVIINASSKYTIRLYLLISSWKEKGHFKININKFKKLLGIEGKYATYYNLKAKVLNPARRELEKRGDIYFWVEPIKNKEGILTGLYFEIKQSKELKKEIEMEEIIRFRKTQNNMRELLNEIDNKEELGLDIEDIVNIVQYYTRDNFQSLDNKIRFLIQYTIENKPKNQRRIYFIGAIKKEVKNFVKERQKEISEAYSIKDEDYSDYIVD